MFYDCIITSISEDSRWIPSPREVRSYYLRIGYLSTCKKIQESLQNCATSFSLDIEHGRCFYSVSLSLFMDTYTSKKGSNLLVNYILSQFGACILYRMFVGMP